MQIELSGEQMAALGKAIARAQVTAVDDYIADETADWPDQSKARIPALEEGDAARLIALRRERPTAIYANEEKARNEAILQERAEQNRMAREDAEKERIAHETPAYEAALAKWKVDRDYALAAGRNAPAEPQKPMSDEELARERSREAVIAGF